MGKFSNFCKLKKLFPIVVLGLLFTNNLSVENLGIDKTVNDY